MGSVQNAIYLVQHAVVRQIIAQIANQVTNLTRALELVHHQQVRLLQVVEEVKIIRLYAQIPKPIIKRQVNAEFALMDVIHVRLPNLVHSVHHFTIYTQTPKIVHRAYT